MNYKSLSFGLGIFSIGFGVVQILATRRAPKAPAIYGAIAFVATAAVVDYLTARALDAQTGKATPRRHAEPGAQARTERPATENSIEPTETSAAETATAPAIA